MKLSLDVYRHSTAHIMASAVQQLFPDTKISIGPAIEDGFYYDFDKKTPFIPEDLKKIEKKMWNIINKKTCFERIEVSKKEAEKIFREKNEAYKLELLDEITDEKVSLYKTGDFIDLCRGPHVESADDIKAFKLLSIAGAYWRGDEKKKMLQRIYGTAWYTKEELNEHVNKLAESKKRDHRKLGKELDLYSMHEEAGAGLIFWHPKGAMIRRVIEDFWYKEHMRRGYQFVNIPHISNVNLWKISGHLDFYKDNMYSPMEIDSQDYIIKPMNCPGHILIYKTNLHSYRELPIRYAELGTVYRYEKSGVLHGMLRVRGFTQDDAHIFCTPNQLKNEIKGVIELVDYMMKTFEFEYKVFLSTRDKSNKFAGSLEDWKKATDTLEDVLKERNMTYEVEEGEAVFYGPKIDIKMKDSLGRLWQGPTVQFDFNLPRRFGVTYIGEDGKEHYVMMVHRTVLGSMERFVGTLIEHYGGTFPTWLAPVQVKILTIGESNIPYAKEMQNQLSVEQIRTELDCRDEKIGLKIRESELDKIPYMLIIGDREVSEKTISVRKHGNRDCVGTDIRRFIDKIKKQIETRKD
ncbi:threonine--tRNA ligase [bacterium]|nr:threonine--tRNA ligase [bacterium]